MALENTCIPVVIYLVFSITQIFIDTYKGLYNVALLKFILMIIFALLLNFLCSVGLGIISWIIVFVPFIFMSLITALLIYFFGLDVKTGKLKTEYDVQPSNSSSSSNINFGKGAKDIADLNKRRQVDIDKRTQELKDIKNKKIDDAIKQERLNPVATTTEQFHPFSFNTDDAFGSNLGI